jgi:DNA replication and repair protein RecF
VHLQRLTLQNFRNYSLATIKPGAGSVVLLGANGAGKTNALEALSLFAPGRGLRRAQIKDMARVDGGGQFAIASRFVDASGLETDLSTGTSPGNDLRQVRLSGELLKGAELENLLQVLWLTPQQDGLFLGAAGDRRRFFDRLALTFDPSHNRYVNAYEKAMRGRNKLLEHNAAPAYFKALEQEMAHLAVAVAAGRLTMLRALSSALQAAQSDEFPQPNIEIVGEVEQALLHKSAAEVEDWFEAELHNTRGRDMAAKRSLSGPHRSDFQVMHVMKNMAAEHCSTGEQKALLVSIILAHTELVSARRKDTPTLLLLDEVAAHFDSQRRKALFERLSNMPAQSWLTGTDAPLFEYMQARLMRVEDGQITAL